MKKLNFLREIESRIHLKKDGRVLGFGTSPQNDWKIISAAFTLLAVATISVSFAIFLRIDKGEIFEVEGPEISQRDILDINRLREVSAYYQEKELEFERIVGGRVTTGTSQSQLPTTTEVIPPFGSSE